jgi:hypothetical protein
MSDTVIAATVGLVSARPSIAVKVRRFRAMKE